MKVKDLILTLSEHYNPEDDIIYALASPDKIIEYAKYCNCNITRPRAEEILRDLASSQFVKFRMNLFRTVEKMVKEAQHL